MLFRAEPPLSSATQPAVEAGQPSPQTLVDWTPSWAPIVLKLRPWLVGVWLLVHLAAFNGQWRIGLDSAQYRAIGHSLAIGEGYAVLGESHDKVYPGLPILLAGLERAFGPDAVWPGIVTMLLISVGVVLLTYRLMRSVLPDWAATIVAAGVAFNWRFVQQGHELMTDLPFLLGVMIALVGLEAVVGGPGRTGMRSTSWPKIAGWLVLAAVGFVLALSMRPTAWVLAVAAALWATGIAIAGLRSRETAQRRRGIAAAVTLCVVVLTGIVFRLFDPRSALSDRGSYERELLERLHQLVNEPSLWLDRLPAVAIEIFDQDIARLFFGERVEILNVVFTIAILVGVFLLAVRRDDPSLRRPLWTLVVAVLMGTLFMLSSEARYWLMVLPILWVGWLMIVFRTGVRLLATMRSRSVFAGVLIAAVFVGNGIHIGKLIYEQRSTPFLRHYKDGVYAPLAEFAQLMRTDTPPDAIFVGPQAPVLSYLSERRVRSQRDLNFGEITDRVDRLLTLRDSDATWMVFPYNPYKPKDYNIGALIRDGALYAANLRQEDGILLELRDTDGTMRTWWAAPFFIDELQIPESERRRLKSEDR